MSQIQPWLQEFRQRWKNQDIEGVLELFTEDVEYHETPFVELENREEIMREWETVENQEDILLDTNVFVSEGCKHAVQFTLRYLKEGEITELRGVYLIRLDERGLCEEFHQFFQSG